jgi:hypothetical protein
MPCAAFRAPIGLRGAGVGVYANVFGPLFPRVRKTEPVLPLVPGAPRTGPMNQKWRVVQNDR